MRSENKRFAAASVDEYIAAFPADVQKILKKIRLTINKAAPKVEEFISYQIPAFKQNGSALIFFAGFQKHVSVYQAPKCAGEFNDELPAYKGENGTVQFPFDKPIPFELIARIVRFRLSMLYK